MRNLIRIPITRLTRPIHIATVITVDHFTFLTSPR